ncbi:MAG: CDP-diacylglycerol--serine O-phosphatidyltransferase [Bacteroidia bacterium]|nr:MAG: CDP-diacylglycerol--serine O-phosphatidyltransferase [Bacteroidia bacterium]
MKHIPNFITSLNLAAGFTAVIFAANGYLTTASWFILAAMIFDFFDGFSARLLNAYSETGKELDSLGDVISFGVAPALIIYKLLVPAVNNILPSSGQGTLFISLLPYVTILMPVCAALRLAKFNTDTTQTTSFKGLPTPANAIAVISVILAAGYAPVPWLKSFTESPATLVIYTIALSVLMVTRLPLLSNKFTSLKFRGNEGRYILIGLVLISLVIFGLTAAPLIIPIYIIVSLISNRFSTKVP